VQSGHLSKLYRFLITKLHMHSLKRKARYSKKALLGAVAGLPKDLEEIYRDTIQRINSQDDDDALLAKQVLAWTHLSYSFLSPRTLQQAIAQHRGDDPESEDCLIDIELLVSVCSGLVTIDEESQFIRLVHYTVEEYLDRSFDELYPSARKKLHISCLRHSLDLSQRHNVTEVRRLAGETQYWYKEFTADLEKREEQRRLHFQKVPFSAYALFHIDILAKVRETGNVGADKFHSPQSREQNWKAVWQTTERYSRELVQAYMIVLARGDFDVRAATFLNDVAEIRRILNSDIRPSSAALSACLAYACLSGYNNIVDAFLQANADVHPMFEDKISSFGVAYCFGKRNCLGLAIMALNQVAVELILNRHPDMATKPAYHAYHDRLTSALGMIRGLYPQNKREVKIIKEMKATVIRFLIDR
jgi:hypothetical protein